MLCGDLQDRGSLKLLESRLESLKFSPIFFVWGNSEEQLNLNTNLEHAHNIHLKHMRLKDLDFIGIGGDEFDLKKEIQIITKLIDSVNPNELIIVSHVPPHNTVDLCNDGRHVGVPEFRALIEEFEPKLVLCGHIHEQCQKVEKIKDTTICNVGPEGILIIIDENLELTLKKLS